MRTTTGIQVRFRRCIKSILFSNIGAFIYTCFAQGTWLYYYYYYYISATVSKKAKKTVWKRSILHRNM